jgi:hypothetical protein
MSETRWLRLRAAGAAAAALAALSVLAPSGALALPTYAARTGFSCVSCHFDPNGGGPRKDIGFLFERQRHDLLPDPDPRWQSLAGLTNVLADILYFGTNSRLLYLYEDPEAYGTSNPDHTSSFFQMQGALYTTFRPHPKLALVWSLDFSDAGAQVRDAYGMLDGLPEDLYLRFGRIRVPFGLRQDDHTGATRGGFLDGGSADTGALPYDPRTTQTGFEVGFYPGPFQISGALTDGPSAPFVDQAQTLIGKVVYLHRRLQIGASVYDSYQTSTGARATRWGGFALYGWRELALIGEVVGGRDRDGSQAVTRLIASYVEADWRFSRALLAIARYDFIDRNLDADGEAGERFGVEGVWTVVPFADLRLALRYIVPEQSGDVPQLLAMWHFYY